MSSPSSSIIKFQKEYKQVVRRARMKALRELVLIIPDFIKSRTREGIGLNSKTGNSLKALDELSDGYKKFRRKHQSKLSKVTSPDESNLTATGQMLNAIVAKIVDDAIKVTIQGDRNRELSGSGSSMSNNQVREYVEKKRPFFELAKSEREYLFKIALQIIKDEISKAIKLS